MSTCIMRFRDAPAPGDTHDSAQGEEHQVLLEPGDLLLLHGDARYSYTHGIDACHQEIWGALPPPRPPPCLTHCHLSRPNARCCSNLSKLSTLRLYVSCVCVCLSVCMYVVYMYSNTVSNSSPRWTP